MGVGATDTAGRVLLAQTFDPYGNPYAQSDGIPPGFGWTRPNL